MKELRFQLYIKGVLAIIEETNTNFPGSDLSNEFLNGKKEALTEILTIMKSERITYQVDLKSLGSRY